ncbi:unnamed protein product [Lymnaea stagnalis]|uniref:Uncharacterized protein n=1 Tax=Lymnaea stagnalis TaxID=6523 RepID=A0AAV2IGM5_LYMST
MFSENKSVRSDLVQSMQVTRQQEVNNSFGDPLDRSGLLRSINVVPKSSGTGYEVHRTAYSRRDSVTLDDSVSVAGDFSFRDFPTAPENLYFTRALRPRPRTSPESGSQFSKNIGNPELRKRVQEKLSEATNRTEFNRAASVSTDATSAPLDGAIRTMSTTPHKYASSVTSWATLPLPEKSYSASVSSRAPSPFQDNRYAASTASRAHSLFSDCRYAASTAPGASSPYHETFNNPDHRYSPATRKDLQVTGSPESKRTLTDGGRFNQPGNSSTVSVSNMHEPYLPANPRSDPLVSHSSSHYVDFVDSRFQTPGDSLQPREPRQTEHAETTPKKSKFFSWFRKDSSRRKPQAPPARIRHSHSVPGSSEQSRPQTQPKLHQSVSVGEAKCGCKLYHTHRFSGVACNHDVEARKERRQAILLAGLQQEELKNDGTDDPRLIFWIPALSFHSYVHGDPLVSFGSLWPKYKELREHLQNSGIQMTVLNAEAVMDLCTLACTCGPPHLLQCLIELGLIRVDQVLDNGSGLLHLSVIAQNPETAQYLVASRISPKIRDKQGLTADQVCLSPYIRKFMAPRYILNKDMTKERVLLKPSLQDKDTIFRLASSPKNFVDIQKKLQTLDFNVNTECDNNGDFVLHIAVKHGLGQLPLLMALIKIQGADIELCNAAGMTPLMLAASLGNYVLCDVLICLFGADPNKPNSLTGRTALHIAAERNHRKTVECLIRRGADVNIEDHDGLRADDIPTCVVVTDDCREVITFNRLRRIEMLSDLVRKGEVVPSQLRPSDLYVVDDEGHTLIMVAAMYNRFQTLHCLLDISKTSMNAQHSKTGMTALAIASRIGNLEAVGVLLRHKACPIIADMEGYLPLQHAVLHNNENTVDIILDHFPSTYVGLYKALRLCKKTSIHAKLKRAWEKRQEEIVNQKLLACALNGDAEDLYKVLEEGDNINPQSGSGNWPTYLAVEHGNLEVFRLLCEKGGNFWQRHATTGATALHVAAKQGHQGIVTYLLQYCKQYRKRRRVQPIPGEEPVKAPVPRGAGGWRSDRASRNRFLDINAMDRDNKTALQLAAESGFSKVVELLLSRGATTAMLDNKGSLVSCSQYDGVRIMIESARTQHTRQVIKAIEDKSRKGLPILQQLWLPRFDHHLRDKDGSTPLMVAAGYGRVSVIQFLLESAVYPENSQYESNSSDTDSDADSGVLDPSPGSRDHSKDGRSLTPH